MVLAALVAKSSAYSMAISLLVAPLVSSMQRPSKDMIFLYDCEWEIPSSRNSVAANAKPQRVTRTSSNM